MIIPDRKIVVGNPAKIVKEMSDERIAWKTAGTRLYQELPAQLRATLKPCEPLRTVPEGRKIQTTSYEIWRESRTEGEDNR
jgi:hypothetical protein